MGLEARHVSVRFGGHYALTDVTISADDGRVTGLIGPNGAGKTTMFNVITGVQAMQSGSVLLHGESIDRLSPHARARGGLGRTFQRLELFGSLTVRENVAVGASRRAGDKTAIVNELLERFDLGSVADTRSDALSTGIGRVIELARCLAALPSVVLLDEPASGQDENETVKFSAGLSALAAEGVAVLLVEHDMAMVMDVCDHIQVLDFGHLIASGSPIDIQKDPKVRSAYLGEEFSL